MGGIAAAITLIAPIALVLPFYFMPALVASGRKHRSSTAIFVLNLLLDWSVLGWIIALVWAFANSRAAPGSLNPGRPAATLEMPEAQGPTERPGAIAVIIGLAVVAVGAGLLSMLVSS